MSKQDSVFIIAEAGVNHNGSLELALQLVDIAKAAGADAIKFQTFKTSKNISRFAPKAEYQLKYTSGSETQYDMVRRLELDEKAHAEIKRRCEEREIEFLSTPFDLDSVDLLLNLGVRRIKIPSGEIVNAPLILKVARTGLPIILSTGMSGIYEIEDALGVLAFGYLGLSKLAPTLEDFRRSFRSEEGKAVVKERVVLLHCTTEYPAPFNEVNLKAMENMRQIFGLPVGLSDHSVGLSVPVAAAALGAVVIEKHFTLNSNLPGPDHKASLEPDELKKMVRLIREVELALGSTVKAPTASEEKNLPIARKSLVAACIIKKGEIFTEHNLTYKRPGTGVSPMHYWEWLGKTAPRDYKEDDVII